MKLFGVIFKMPSFTASYGKFLSLNKEDEEVEISDCLDTKNQL
jgi:hypothetical protein